jgi:CO/xanthine dehydrogenase Mo-binding subunit
MAHIAFARSPHAHARIRRISTDRAAGLRGLLRVVTAAVWAAAMLG